MELQGYWRNGWQITRILLSILVLQAFACATSIEFFGWSLNRSLTNTVTYTNMIQQTNLLGEGRIYLTGVFANMAQEKAQGIPLLNRVPQEGWQAMVEMLLPEPWVEKTVNDGVQAMVTWMQNENQALPEIMIDLTPIKDNLRSQQGVNAVLLLAQYLPTCTWSESLLDLFKLATLQCVPKGADLTPVATLIADTFADLFPSQIIISTSSQATMLSPIAFIGFKLHSAYQLYKAVLPLGLSLSLLFLSVYGLLNSVSLRRLLRASPWPFYAAGILTITLVFLGYLISRPFLAWAFSRLAPQGGVDISVLLVNGFLSIGGAIGRPLLWWGIGILSAGILLHLLSLTIESARIRRYRSVQT